MVVVCVLVLTDATSLAHWGGSVLAHNAQWASARGYTLMVKPFERNTWEVPIRVKDVLETSSCDSIMYLDADAIVANASWDIPTFDGDVLFTAHPDGSINTGVFFVKNTRTTHCIFDWWSDFGNKSCAEGAQWPEQTCAQRIPSLWTSAHLTRNMTLNYPVPIFDAKTYLQLPAVMQACTRSQAICHPYGIRFWCKHRREERESVTECMQRAREYLFSPYSRRPAAATRDVRVGSDDPWEVRGAGQRPKRDFSPPAP